MTTIPEITTPWYDSHANLLTLAEWIRENNGWNFCKENLLDVLEKPWKWQKEWRLASGSVDFELIERPRDILDDPLVDGISTDHTSCEWCDTLVGLVSFDREVHWVTVYRDRISGDFACDDCAGQAANFRQPEPAASVPTGFPEITAEMREHFAAFGHTELFPVVIARTVQTELGNILIEEGDRTWGARNTDPDMSHGSISVWTKDTHYAGIKTSSIRASDYVRMATVTVKLS